MTQSAILAASGSPGTTTGFKNRLINGDFRVSQYNGASSVTNPSNNQYTIDRWQINTGFTGSIGQNLGGVTPPPGYSNYLGMSVGAAGQSIANYSFRQWIEGYNTADLGWGTANAKTVTLSFWAQSSVTGTFGGAIQNGAQNRSYPFSYTISAANTWTQVTVTVPGDTSGTWVGATNGYGMHVVIAYCATSTGTPNAWAGADYRAPTGQTNLFATNGATFYITGVQLEVGTTATNFDFRSYGTELALCQRYFYKTTVSTGYIGVINSNLRSTPVPSSFPVNMRATPTVVSGFVNQDSGADGGYEVSNSTLTLKVYNANTTGYASVYWNYTATAEL